MGKALTRRRKNRGGSQFAGLTAGRPRKVGDRKPCGRLKPERIDPNPVIVDQRRALIGNPAAKGVQLRSGENPMDLMLARGWLGRELHDAGEAFADMHRRSGLSVQQLKAANLEGGARGHDARKADAVALWRLNTIWARLTPYPAAKNALIDLCLLGAWPKWLLDLLSGAPDVMTGDRHALRLGLAMVHVVVQIARPIEIANGSDQSRMVDYLKRGLRAA